MSLITDKELCHSPRKLQKKQPPLNLSNTLKKQKVPVQSCCGELLTLEEESNDEGHLQRDCAHLVLVGHGCLPSSGEATSFICFQLFRLQGGDGVIPPSLRSPAPAPLPVTRVSKPSVPMSPWWVLHWMWSELWGLEGNLKSWQIPQSSGFQTGHLCKPGSQCWKLAAANKTWGLCPKNSERRTHNWSKQRQHFLIQLWALFTP